MELLHYLLPELPSWAKWINYLVFLLGTTLFAAIRLERDFASLSEVTGRKSAKGSGAAMEKGEHLDRAV